jgi:hypothetical protein
MVKPYDYCKSDTVLTKEMHLIIQGTTTLKMNHTRAKQKSGNEMHPSPDVYFF